MGWYEQTKYGDLENVCREKFGPHEGGKIFRAAEALFGEMMAEMDDRGSAAVRGHLTGNIFPVLAYYRALLGVGLTAETAYGAVLEETQKRARLAAAKNARLARLPFVYELLRRLCVPMMRKKFPPEGWETEWVRRDGEQVHFNLRRCVYYDTAEAYGCPELCRVFCQNDITAFGGYLPKIRFAREGTIAGGAEFCDFHFHNGAREQGHRDRASSENTGAAQAPFSQR